MNSVVAKDLAVSTKLSASLMRLKESSASEKPVLNETQQLFRNAMSNLAAAVNIISTDGPAGRAGFTASAVCSV